MTIISIGNFSGVGWDGSRTDENHIAEALEELGHEVIRYQREDTREAYWKLPNADFALIQQWDGYAEDLITRLRFFTKTVVVWSFDYQAWGQEWHERLVAETDLYLSKRIADSKYPNWQWLSQDFAPSFLDRYGASNGISPEIANVSKDIDVLFTGSYLDWATERNETVKAVNEKFNLVVHSVNDWPFLKRQPPVMDHDLPRLYARAKVILSIDHTIEAGYWSDRNAQIIACGRRPLFRYVPLSEARFGDKISYFYSVEDCLGGIQTMLDYPEMFADAPSTEGLYVKDRVKDLLTIVQGIL